MKELYADIKRLVKEKRVIWPLCLTAVLSYAYLWTHPSMGVDDTAMKRYFIDGFAPHLGRWTLFLLGKLVHIIEFTPVVTDFFGVLFMGMAALIMAAGLQRSSQHRLGTEAVMVFSCFMISCPLINEVYVYYLHNGLGLGYMLTAAAYYLARFGRRREKFLPAVFLTLALGCYETFAEVFLLLLFADTLVRIAFSGDRLTFKAWLVLFLQCCAAIIAAMLARNLIDRFILWVIQVEPYIHSVGKEIGWIFSAQAGETLRGMIRGFGRYYVLNATVNYGIALFWLAMLILGLFGVIQAAKKKSWLCVLNLLGVLGVSWVITIIEGNVGAYRTMQTFPILIGLAMALLYYGLLCLNGRRAVRNLGFVFLAVLLYNQVYETNKWYYVDYMKYEEEVAICRQLAWDIRREATMDKPLIFIGRIEEYGTADAYMYVKSDSWQYRLFSRLDGNSGTDKKYEIVQNPVWYSVFDWGTDAFDEHATEIANFFAFHGYPIQVASREEMREMSPCAQELPVWPKEGSILELEDYVIVKLGESESP